MKRLFLIARTEVLEQRRQPWMLFILAANYLLWMALFGGLLLVFDRAAANPGALASLTQQLKGFGVELDAFLKLATSTFGSMLFTNLPLYVAILAGTSVLHDRECGTLPFLMLAPLTRRELLLGKLAGALALPTALHLLFVGSTSLVMVNLPSLGPYACKFGACGAWWVAFLLGAPASAAFVGALGTVISALSRDVRTSMQYTSFFIGLLSLGLGYVLVDGLSQGVAVQLAFAVGSLVAAALVLGVGAQLISRDVNGG